MALEGLIALAIYFAFFLMSIVAHEYAHGWMALQLGDPTALKAGRLSWNPIRHIDPMWTIVIPMIAFISHMPLIGGAKPVPINPFLFKNPRIGDRYVSIAGVATNLLIAIALSMVLRTGLIPKESVLFVILGMTTFVNLLLCLFNLIPVPPLDGSHLLASVLPEPLATKYQSVGFGGIILILLLMRVSAFRSIYSLVLLFMWRHVLMLDVNVLEEIMKGYDDIMKMVK